MHSRKLSHTTEKDCCILGLQRLSDQILYCKRLHWKKHGFHLHRTVKFTSWFFFFFFPIYFIIKDPIKKKYLPIWENVSTDVQHSVQSCRFQKPKQLQGPIGITEHIFLKFFFHMLYIVIHQVSELVCESMKYLVNHSLSRRIFQLANFCSCFIVLLRKEDKREINLRLYLKQLPATGQEDTVQSAKLLNCKHHPIQQLPAACGYQALEMRIAQIEIC